MFLTRNYEERDLADEFLRSYYRHNYCTKYRRADLKIYLKSALNIVRNRLSLIERKYCFRPGAEMANGGLCHLHWKGN